MKTGIYETRGRAKEFCELAMNHYAGCGHRCVSCYGPDVVHRNRPDWYNQPGPRLVPGDILRSAQRWRIKIEDEYYPHDTVLLCFVTDPYQPIEADWKLTRSAIEILNHHNLAVHILTKAGPLAQRDFDLLSQNTGNAFAATLTCSSDEDSKLWEPGAAIPSERIDNLFEAYRRGIQTWVSLEPVIEPDWTFALIEETHAYVGHFKVGTLNYHPAGKKIDWREFAVEVQMSLDRLGARYYIKKDLAKYLGYTAGFWGGPA